LGLVRSRDDREQAKSIFTMSTCWHIIKSGLAAVDKTAQAC
jgi:hypothetical protein